MNLCSAKVESIDSLRRFTGLKRIAIRNEYLTRSILKHLQNSNVKIVRCECKEDEAECKFIK